MRLLHGIALLSLGLTVPSTLFLYFYPFFLRCGFPVPPTASGAPFRLLAFGDPQLEGDTSINRPRDGYFPHLTHLRDELAPTDSTGDRLRVITDAIVGTVTRDLPARLQVWRKQLDLWGNDLYLAHIYRIMHWYTQPTHVTVLGDLLGSQWIDDQEFTRRSMRYWKTVFRNGMRVEQEIMNGTREEIFGADKRWTRRIINAAGNHDVGYAGDMDRGRVKRFEREFGRVNWDIWFRSIMPGVWEDNTPTLRIILLNSMNLDLPAKDIDLQHETYDFINDVIKRSRPVEERVIGTILLTHIPLEKPPGVCVDSPYFDYYINGNGIKEQYQLSYQASKTVLESIFGFHGDKNAAYGGLGRKGLILTGHDHEGCDVYHHLPDLGPERGGQDRRWNATRWADAKQVRQRPIPGIREVTVRSMMGDFGGNAGLVSAWFAHGEWHFEYSTCSVGVQHIWWVVHGLVLATLGAFGLCMVATAVP